MVERTHRTHIAPTRPRSPTLAYCTRRTRAGLARGCAPPTGRHGVCAVCASSCACVRGDACAARAICPAVTKLLKIDEYIESLENYFDVNLRVIRVVFMLVKMCFRARRPLARPLPACPTSPVPSPDDPRPLASHSIHSPDAPVRSPHTLFTRLTPYPRSPHSRRPRRSLPFYGLLLVRHHDTRAHRADVARDVRRRDSYTRRLVHGARLLLRNLLGDDDDDHCRLRRHDTHQYDAGGARTRELKHGSSNTGAQTRELKHGSSNTGARTQELEHWTS